MRRGGRRGGGGGGGGLGGRGRRGGWARGRGGGPGEDPAAAALREVEEETGARGRLVGKLGDVRYVYTWAGERVFKVVSFYLVRYSGGRLGEIAAEFAHEVAETRWLPLDEAPGSSPTRASGRWRRRRSRPPAREPACRRVLAR